MMVPGAPALPGSPALPNGPTGHGASEKSINRRLLDEISLISRTLDRCIPRFEAEPLSVAPPAAVTSIANALPARSSSSSSVLGGCRYWSRLSGDRMDPIGKIILPMWMTALSGCHGAVVAISSALKDLPLNSLPKRVLPIFVDRFPERSEFESADAVELQLYEDGSEASSGPRLDSSFRRPSWSWEMTSTSQWRQKVEFVREITRRQAPIGAAIVKGDVAKDLEQVLSAKLDFVTLLDAQASSSSIAIPDAWCLSIARKVALQTGQPDLKIFIEADFGSAEDVAKLGALGAAGVVVDSLFWQVHHEFVMAADQSSLTSGLGSLAAVSRAPLSRSKLESAIKSAFHGLEAELSTIMLRCHCRKFSDLGQEHLVALSDFAGQMAGIRVLGRDDASRPSGLENARPGG